MAFYEFTEPALKQFQQLDSWLGEETLDELEALVINPPTPRLRSPTGFVHDFTRIRAGATIYVFLTVTFDAASQCFRVTTVGQFIRQ